MKKLLIILSTFLLILACKHTILEPITINGGSGTTTDTICFANTILPIYQSYCASAGCHNATSRADGVVTVDYPTIMKGISAGNPSSSKYFTEITKGKMPPAGYPKLNTTQISLIQNWILQGAKNNTCNNNCDTSKYTYSNAVQTIFTNSCNGCHGNSPGSGNVYLGTYVASQSYINANKLLFLKAINHDATLTAAQRMPQGTKMDTCSINTITKWINTGMPQ